jgi:hypothetical protein
VRCESPKLAYDLLPAKTMQMLLAGAPLHLRLYGDQAVCWESGKHSPVQLLARLTTIDALLNGVPSYVWTDLKGSAS